MFHASSHKKELVCDLTITRHICAFFQIVLVLTDFQHLITMASCFCVKVSETTKQFQRSLFTYHFSRRERPFVVGVVVVGVSKANINKWESKFSLNPQVYTRVYIYFTHTHTHTYIYIYIYML